MRKIGACRGKAGHNIDGFCRYPRFLFLPAPPERCGFSKASFNSERDFIVAALPPIIGFLYSLFGASTRRVFSIFAADFVVAEICSAPSFFIREIFFFKRFDISGEFLNADFMSSSRSSSFEKGLHFFHSRAPRALLAAAADFTAPLEAFPHSKNFSGESDIAPKLEAVRRKRLSRVTTRISCGRLDVAHICS